MKVRRKPKKERSRFKGNQNLRPPWKPGYCPNPKGRPLGSGSIVHWLKKRLAGAASTKERRRKFRSLADELAAVILDKAERGKFQYLRMLLERADASLLTEDDMREQIERVYRVVRRYVTDPQILANIATDLRVQEIEEVE